MRVYDYITQAYRADKGGRGELARELVRLAEKDKTVKDMDTFIAYTVVEDKVYHNSQAYQAMTEALYCEACTACGLPIT